MEARAIAKHVRIAPRKIRIVADLVRGKNVSEAMAILKFTPKVGSKVVEKVIRSAAANAEHNNDMNVDALYISEIFVDQDSTMKRIHPRSRGQAFKILKKSSHVTVVVKERALGGKCSGSKSKCPWVSCRCCKTLGCQMVC